MLLPDLRVTDTKELLDFLIPSLDFSQFSVADLKEIILRLKDYIEELRGVESERYDHLKEKTITYRGALSDIKTILSAIDLNIEID